MTLIDTNVLLDLVTDDPVWADWSIARLDAASLSGPLQINDAIYAELAVRYATIETLDAFPGRCRNIQASNPKRGAISSGQGLSKLPPRRLYEK